MGYKGISTPAVASGRTVRGHHHGPDLSSKNAVWPMHAFYHPPEPVTFPVLCERELKGSVCAGQKPSICHPYSSPLPTHLH